MRGPALIEITGLSAGYEQKVLFSGLNLSIRAGELVCFMGPNGVGKSTLIRTLGGLIEPIAGTIICQGPSIAKEELLSLVLTDPVQASYLTVYDLIVFGRYPYLDWTLSLKPEDNQLVEQAIDMVNLQHLRERPIHQLSDGQRQMAMIARALAQNTPVIILDEPTSHLDLNNRVEIMRLLKDLTRSANKAVVLATHELDLALQTADVIWLGSNDGTIVTGIPEDLVLQGAFDEIFKFKGFDLKTGRVQHKVFRDLSVRVTGEGHALLWTKSFLERSGYRTDADADVTVSLIAGTDEMIWRISDGTDVQCLAALGEHLAQIRPRR